MSYFCTVVSGAILIIASGCVTQGKNEAYCGKVHSAGIQKAQAQADALPNRPLDLATAFADAGLEEVYRRLTSVASDNTNSQLHQRDSWVAQARDRLRRAPGLTAGQYIVLDWLHRTERDDLEFGTFVFEPREGPDILMRGERSFARHHVLQTPCWQLMRTLATDAFSAGVNYRELITKAEKHRNWVRSAFCLTYFDGSSWHQRIIVEPNTVTFRAPETDGLLTMLSEIDLNIGFDFPRDDKVRKQIQDHGCD